jgi:hypothetical protein
LVAVEASFAYVVSTDGTFYALDMQDPTRPRLVGSVPLPDWHGIAPELQVSGSVAYVIGSMGELTIIDVSSPESPEVLTGDALGDTWIARFVLSPDGRLAYASTEPFTDPFTEVAVLDLSDPVAPRIIGTYSTADSVLDLFATQDRLYIAGCISLEVLSTEVPHSPARLGSLSINGGSLSVSGTLAFLASSGRFNIVDVANPGEMRRLSSSFVFDRFATAILASDGLAFAVYEWGLHIFDVTEPGGGLQRLGEHRAAPPNGPRDIQSDGPNLYVMDDGSPLDHNDRREVDTLRVFDASVAEGPIEMGSAAVSVRPPRSGAARLHVVDGVAYIASNGLTIWDVRDPTSIEQLTESVVEGTAGASDVHVRDGVAFLCSTDVARGYSLITVDVGDAAAPRTLARESFAHESSGNFYTRCTVAADETHAIVAGPYEGFGVLDISNPAAPSEISFVPVVPEGPWSVHLESVALWRGHAFIAARTRGLMVFDLREPERPQLVATLRFEGSTTDIAIRDHHLFVATGDSVQVIDVQEPSRPMTVGMAAAPSSAVTASDGRAFTSSFAGGLFAFDVASVPVRSRLWLPQVGAADR